MAKRGFIHDEDASNHPKLLALRMDFGWEGIGLFWGLIEKLRSANAQQLQTNCIASLAYGFSVDKERLSDIVSKCMELGLFKVEDDAFHSPRLTKQVGEYVAKCDQLRANAKQKHSKSKASAKQIPNVSVSVSESVKKGSIKKELISIGEFFKCTALQRDQLISEDTEPVFLARVRKINDYVANHKPYKDYPAAYRTFRDNASKFDGQTSNGTAKKKQTILEWAEEQDRLSEGK